MIQNNLDLHTKILTNIADTLVHTKCNLCCQSYYNEEKENIFFYSEQTYFLLFSIILIPFFNEIQIYNIANPG